jgi:hypothetical protein
MYRPLVQHIIRNQQADRQYAVLSVTCTLGKYLVLRRPRWISAFSTFAFPHSPLHLTLAL